MKKVLPDFSGVMTIHDASSSSPKPILKTSLAHSKSREVPLLFLNML